jgi:transaldolase
MKLFIDSADHRHWQLPPGCPHIAGATTNPTLVHRAGLSVSLPTYQRLLAQAVDAGLGALMLQLPRAHLPEAHAWMDALQKQSADAAVELTIKLPCHADWAPLMAAVRARGLGLLITGVANPVQLLWSRQQGAHYVAPYLGRLEVAGRDVWALVGACVAMQSQGTDLLAASIASADVLTRLIAAGAAAATLKAELVASLATDPVTEAAMAQFANDVQASQSAAALGQT